MMKCLRVIVVSVVFCMIFLAGTPFLGNASEGSECFKCHTSAKKLIDATREIAKTKPAAKATESEGEG
jgi:hypothetical protein